MKRTINEKKAWDNIILFTIVNLVSLMVFGASIRTPSIILGAICISGYFISLFLLCFNFYSLGWEYKRISLIEDTEELQSETEGEDEE